MTDREQQPRGSVARPRGIVRWIGWQVRLYNRWRVFRHGGEVYARFEITEAWRDD